MKYRWIKWQSNVDKFNWKVAKEKFILLVLDTSVYHKTMVVRRNDQICLLKWKQKIQESIAFDHAKQEFINDKLLWKKYRYTHAFKNIIERCHLWRDNEEDILVCAETKLCI